MSEVKRMDEQTPPCPLCAGLTKLKDLWELEDGFHQFFKCQECSIQFPVVVPKDGS